MKNIYWFILLLIGFVACQQNDEKCYEGNDSIYFQIAEDWTKTQDSIVYSFAGKGMDTDSLMLQINLQGNISSHNRKIKLVINEELTTAKEGLHYEALKEEYVLAAGKYETQIPFVIYKKDALLEQKTFSILLELRPSDDFQLGIAERTYVKVLISNMLKKPSYWDSSIHYHFSVYSRVKHELCIYKLGTDFPDDKSNYDYTLWSVYGKYMSNYFEENYPIYDENHVIIEPW